MNRREMMAAMLAAAIPVTVPRPKLYPTWRLWVANEPGIPYRCCHRPYLHGMYQQAEMTVVLYRGWKE